MKIFIFLLSVISIFVALFIFIQWLRQGLSPLFFDLMVSRLKAYMFGYLSAFTLWFDNIDNFFILNLDLYTFAGPMNLFGLLERNLGFYNPIYINEITSTNIFTAFRGLINDFNPFGVLLIIFLLGFYMQVIFQKIKIRFSDGLISLSIFYSFTLYSPLISIFHYNSIFFSWVLIYFVTKFHFSNVDLVNNS